MNLSRYIVVFDYETTGVDVETCDIIQIGAVTIDLRTLNILDDSFNITVKPDGFGESYFQSNIQTFSWHSEKRGIPLPDLYQTINNGIREKYAMESFIKYCDKYRMEGGMEGSVVPAGQNITGFDLPITKRITTKHKFKYPFDDYYKLDLRDITNLWFMFSTMPPPSRSLDTLREYFELPTEGAHDAYNDSITCAKIIQVFLKLHKTITPRIGALNGEKAYIF